MSTHTHFAPADRRAIVLPGVPGDNTYTFHIRGYRKVDKDIDASGVILSDAVTTPAYKPLDMPVFAGDIIGTIQGRHSLLVVQELEAVISDGILSKAEKPGAVAAYNQAIADYNGLYAAAQGLGQVATQLTAATNAKNALTNYLQSLNPDWNDTAENTPINPTTYLSTWNNFYVALADLQHALTRNPAYSDNTPIDDLKPSEPGATDGAQAGDNLTDENGDVLGDGDIITGLGISADTFKVNGVASADVINAIATAQAGVDDLVDTYGSTASAAASASAAEGYADTAQTAADNAAAAETAAQAARDLASGYSTTAGQAKADAESAASSSTAAKNAAEAAKTASETARDQAQTSATNSTAAKNAAEAAQEASETARDEAGTSATDAAGSASAAAGSATVASTKATEAGNSATAAQASAVTAGTKATEAGSSATAAAGSASSAATYAGAAEDSASAASTSETNAASSASTASTKATQASDAASDAEGSASSAETSATNAAASETAAGSSAAAAAGSASTATTKAGEAGNSATAAQGYATTASTKADDASDSADAAATSATAAASSQDAAGVSAAAAQQAEVSATIAAMPLTPGSFPNDEYYWSWQRLGPEDTTVLTSHGAFSKDADGIIFDQGYGSSNTLIVPKYQPPKRLGQRTWRLTIECKWDSNPEDEIVSMSPRVIGTNSSYSYVATIGAGSLIEMTDEWATYEVDITFNAPSNTDIVYYHPTIYTTITGTSQNAVIHIRSIGWQDVTESESAADSASAAATSASSAAVSKTDAETAASSASSSATTATTKAGEASTSASQAATSATNAQGSANTATTKATLAAGSADAAAGSASAAAGSASTATTKASEAATSASSASGSANTATTKASEAATSATAAAGSASAALSSQTAAGSSASAAQQAETGAKITASYLMPSDFQQDGLLWSRQIAGNPAPDLGTSYTFETVAGVGRACRMDQDAVGGTSVYMDLRPKGYVKLQPGRRYRATARARLVEASSGGGDRFSLFFPSTTSAYAWAGYSYNGPATAVTVASGWVEVEVEVDADTLIAGAPTAVYTMPVFRWNRNSGGVVNGAAQVEYIRFVDITESESAADSASAAATSASSAAVSKTDAETAASSASSSATTATTKAGEASTSASQAATSASNALGSANTASTQAGLAAGSATAAGSSATAAAGSASTATTKASEASTSASAAAASSLSARTSASKTLPSQVGVFDDFVNYNSAAPVQESATPGWGTSKTVSGEGVVREFVANRYIFTTRGKLPKGTGRTFRVKVRFRTTTSTATHGIYLGFFCYDADDSYMTTVNWAYKGQSWASDGWTEIVATVTSDQLTGSYLRAGMATNSAGGTGNSGGTMEVAQLVFEDITESTAAAASASAASASAVSASDYAATASTQAGIASGYKDTAQAAATAASGSATTASGAAAAAASSSSLAANYSAAAQRTTDSKIADGSHFALSPNPTIGSEIAATPTTGAGGAACFALTSQSYVAKIHLSPVAAGRTYRFYVDCDTNGIDLPGVVYPRLYGESGGALSTPASSGFTATSTRQVRTVDITYSSGAIGSATQIRPAFKNNQSSGTDQLRVYGFWMEDVTALLASEAQASISTSQAAIATAQAAAAEATKNLTVSLANRLLNKNAGYDDYPSSTVGQRPTNWIDYANGVASYRVDDALGGYGWRCIGPAGSNSGGRQTIHKYDKLLVNDGYYVIEADAILNSGSFAGAGVLFRPWNASGSASQDHLLSFYADTSNSGAAVGAGTPGKAYHFSKMVRISLSDANGFELFNMTHWTGFGQSTSAANDITWLGCGIRPATPEEIATGTVLPTLSAAVSSHTSALATHDTQLADLETTVSTQGATITTQQTSLNGLQLRYSVTLNSNGHISGFQQNNNGTTSDFIVQADKFMVAMPGYTPKVIFGVNAAGVLVNGDLLVNSGRIVADTGTHMKVLGKGFGTSNQFVAWFGPKMSINLCSEANAISYEKTNGDAYFGGALTAGALSNSVTGSSLASTASADTGPLGSNGNSIVVSVSWTYSQTWVSNFPGTAPGMSDWDDKYEEITGEAPPVGGFSEWSGSVAVPSSSVTLKRKVGTGSLATVQTGSTTTMNVVLNGSRPEIGTAGSLTVYCTSAVTFTYTDNAMSTSDRQYTATLSRGSVNPGLDLLTQQAQRITINTVEE